VWLMLSPVIDAQILPDLLPQKPVGYAGDKKTVVVVDDEPAHRGLIGDILIPLGFNLVECADAESLLNLRTQIAPDIFLLDVNLPGMQGWELVQHLRMYFPHAPLVMLSANVHEEQGADLLNPLHNAYLLKPIKITHLLDVLQKTLALTWCYTRGDTNAKEKVVEEKLLAGIDAEQITQAIEWANDGYFSALKKLLDSWEAVLGADNAHCKVLKAHLHSMQFNRLSEYLSGLL
jgi:CheY-like chemotaxis protein